ncbi:PEP-CTERM sorting domain-containing protein [Nostoc sp. FACHB-110]|uniref:PEP-CTERM sorting domain-containing protein n=1 Tax=Nostoc sp. FACHB-110 TaxID=2692834 RepID=UPI001683C063|nr:PEP-CTERM sorting domain-containing protein [Nostoc sp. FACHB-110]MBD2439774.1 PEP-CTERM sorting domain-containing protein [Nostoc sp. FACHB-110]
MNQVRLPKARVALIGLVVASVFHATPVLGAILTRQEFAGDFTLIEANPFLSNFLQKQSEYSGFVVYADNGSLNDWQLTVNNLGLNLNPASTSSSFLKPRINFELNSGSDWELVVDFGIAFDAPRYTLQRTAISEIRLTGEVGRAGTYIYQDPAANISVSSSSTSIPEPSTLFGLFLAIAAIAASKKANRLV